MINIKGTYPHRTTDKARYDATTELVKQAKILKASINDDYEGALVLEALRELDKELNFLFQSFGLERDK